MSNGLGMEIVVFSVHFLSFLHSVMVSVGRLKDVCCHFLSVYKMYSLLVVLMLDVYGSY